MLASAKALAEGAGHAALHYSVILRTALNLLKLIFYTII